MSGLTEDDTEKHDDELTGEMHAHFADLERRGFPLSEICFCAVQTALTRLHRTAPLDETLEWCRGVAEVLQHQVELRSAFERELLNNQIN